MARLLNDAATESLLIEQVIPSGDMPFAFVGWFNSNDINHTGTLFSLGDKDVEDQYYALLIRDTTSSNHLQIQSRNADINFAETSTGYSVNTWHHACGICASATDRRVLLDGAGKGTNATSRTPASPDRTVLGNLARTTGAAYFSGHLAECAIYDLSAWPGANDGLKATAFEKILPSLAKGFTPAHFPLGLVAYWPLIRGLNDRVGSYNLTADGTVVAAHPRVIMPCGVL